ncbi:hypothetical protein [Lactiplantibacillus pentosus]|uniref:hypothetical protein n=1 Tax=Lactiplantibacillus pentosus TaxID=1589 RepID=UPI002182555C|nr:hypothetical protein [Lactiplantibacillus pentosus]
MGYPLKRKQWLAYCSSAMIVRFRLPGLEQGGHRFELTQKITAQFQIRVFF